MGKELLLEIGTEEIPAAFLPRAMADMEELIRKALDGERVKYGPVTTMATPRRLVLHVEDVAETQEDQVIEKIGPTRKAAFDKDGNPTRAAEGFARGQGMDLREIEIIATDKGEYLRARKRIAGGDVAAMLPALLARFILAIPFKKAMRWSDLEIRFARPIHWLLALYGGEVIPVRIETIEAGNASRGHRFMSPAPFAVSDFRDYLDKARKAWVIVDPEERKRIIQDEARRSAATVNGRPLIADDLLETVAFLVEYPTAVCGAFDPEYLELPREVLTTTMMSHQKYFPVVNDAGRLLPHFVAINNTPVRDPAVVTRGNEKVIRARLSDARFFFEEDQKISLDRRFEDLRKVVYHSLLGTSHEKVLRFRKLAALIVGRIDPALAAAVDRAAVLAKADLDTQMVGEFSELQGVMGREYALLAGEDPLIAKAIHEHYLPLAAGGELPESDIGAIVGIADKMDTIVGFFGVNLIPSGTADPYALRRQALGIINIILAKGYPLRLAELTAASIDILRDKLKRPEEDVARDVLDFFRTRFENQLIAQGHAYDVVDAALAIDASDLVEASRKIEALEAFRNHADFQPLVTACKRVANILKDFRHGETRPTLFREDAERELYRVFQEARERAAALLDERRYEAALTEMARLRAPVDAFFDAVMVMAKEDEIRFNRLSLLEEIAALFRRVADFSKLVTDF
ncbi:MAG: glycine--tRNA ligase subunit beta [Pseudomonadota bacterium]|nr:glycine--tRNA ligase subunit beta [Pseudomonadota bacterium]